MGRSSEAKNPKNPKKVKCDGQTNGRTDGPTDGPTKRVVESRNTRLKTTDTYRNIKVMDDKKINAVKSITLSAQWLAMVRNNRNWSHNMASNLCEDHRLYKIARVQGDIRWQENYYRHG